MCIYKRKDTRRNTQNKYIFKRTVKGAFRMVKIISSIIILLFLIQLCLCDVTLNTNDMELIRTYINSIETENNLLLSTKSYYSNQYFYTYITLTNYKSDYRKEVNRVRWTWVGIATAVVISFILGTYFGNSN